MNTEQHNGYTYLKDCYQWEIQSDHNTLMVFGSHSQDVKFHVVTSLCVSSRCRKHLLATRPSPRVKLNVTDLLTNKTKYHFPLTTSSKCFVAGQLSMSHTDAKGHLVHLLMICLNHINSPILIQSRGSSSLLSP